jgi:RecA-family ATPase
MSAAFDLEGWRNDWRKRIAGVPDHDERLDIFRQAAFEIGGHLGNGVAKPDAIDALFEMAEANGHFGLGRDEIGHIVGHEFGRAEQDEVRREDFVEETIRRWERADERRAAQTNGKAGDEASPPLPFVDIAAWQDQPVPPQEWLAFRRIPHENVTLLGGDGATGKTTIALQLCVCVVTGKEWIGSVIERVGPVLFYTAEESEKELHRRLAAIRADYRVSYADIADKFFAHCRPADDAILGLPDRNGIIRPTAAFEQLQRAVLDIRPRLVCLEAASDLFGGDENKRPQVRGFLGLLRGSLAMQCETAVVLLQHPSLSGIASGSGTSGSTQWNNSARSRLYLSTVKANGESGEPDHDLRKLEVMKANFGPRGELIKLRWREGVFAVEAEPSTLEKLAREQKADATFLQLLNRFVGQKQQVSQNVGRTYAPALFADHPDAGGIKSAEFAKAMQRLLDAGKVHIEVSGPPSKRRPLLAPGPATGRHALAGGDR